MVSISNMNVQFNAPSYAEVIDTCEWDSTWEEFETKTPRKECYRTNRKTSAARRMQDFRHYYRSIMRQIQNPYAPVQEPLYNLEFYRSQRKSSPDDVSIDEFHSNWGGKYSKLEEVHSYIQWLFPLHEQGFNRRAHPLRNREIKCFRGDEKLKKKLLTSYEMMLDFYGVELVNRDTGEVKRASNWEERFSNLNRHSHNNLRITRILKCLGILGLEKYQAPLVKFFLQETLVEGTLPNVRQSALDYFMFAVLRRSERQELVKFAFKHFRPRNNFVWGPKKLLEGFEVQDEKNRSGFSSVRNYSAKTDTANLLKVERSGCKDDNSSNVTQMPEKSNGGNSTQERKEKVNQELEKSHPAEKMKRKENCEEINKKPEETLPVENTERKENCEERKKKPEEKKTDENEKRKHNGENISEKSANKNFEKEQDREDVTQSLAVDSLQDKKKKRKGDEEKKVYKIPPNNTIGGGETESKENGKMEQRSQMTKRKKNNKKHKKSHEKRKQKKRNK